ncbi:DUF1501 domain-containing protein [Saccharothrix isguenensis]
MRHAFADVNVVLMSEFGRRVEGNGSSGFDHGGGRLMSLLGGGLRGGRAHGSWPVLAADAARPPPSSPTTPSRTWASSPESPVMRSGGTRLTTRCAASAPARSRRSLDTRTWVVRAVAGGASPHNTSIDRSLLPSRFASSTSSVRCRNAGTCTAFPP